MMTAPIITIAVATGNSSEGAGDAGGAVVVVVTTGPSAGIRVFAVENTVGFGT